MIKTIEDRVEEYLNNLSIKNINLSNFLRIYKDWRYVAGVTISKICAPSFLYRNILTITVIDSSWAYEINMQKISILKKIKERTNIDIDNIRTIIGEIENIQSEKKESQKKDIYLTDGELCLINEVSHSMDNILDDDIKNLFKKIISKQIKIEKSEKHDR